MATNSDIAYNIYKTIKEKQKEQIKQGTIKESDIIELSENDFINDLHETILFQTSSLQGFENLEKDMQIAIINSTYVNIFDSIEQVKDIKELISSDGVKIPNEIIKASIKSAVEKNENVINKINLVEETIAVGIMAELMLLETVEEKMNFFETLSEKEQKEVIYELTENNFGKDVADRRREVDQEIEFFKNSQSRMHMSEEDAQRVEKKMKQKNPMLAIARKLGIESFDENDVYREGKIEIIITAMRDEFSDKVPSYEELIEYLQENAKPYINDDEIKGLAKTLSEIKGMSIEEVFKNLGYEEVQKERQVCEDNLNKYKDIIIETLSKAYPEFENEIDFNDLIYVVRGVFEDGEIDFQTLITRFERYLSINKEHYTIDFESYKQSTEFIKKTMVSLREETESMDLPSEISTDADLFVKFRDAIKEDGTIDKERLTEILEERDEVLSMDVSVDDFPEMSEDFTNMFLENAGVLEVSNELEKMENSSSQPLPEEVAAELQAIPVALQRINCQPEDIAKGMEAYRQMIGLLTPEEINSEPEALTEILKKAVGEINLDGVAGDILKMMSQITFNGQLSEILKNSKDAFITSLNGPLLDPRVYAVNPEQNNSNSSNSSSLTERVDEDTLKAGFEALAVDLQIADPTIIRPEELVTDENTQLENGQEENTELPKKEARKEKAEGAVISKLQAFFGVYRNAGMIEVQEVSEEIKEIVQELDLNLQNNNVHRVEEEIKNDEGIEQG